MHCPSTHSTDDICYPTTMLTFFPTHLLISHIPSSHTISPLLLLLLLLGDDDHHYHLSDDWRVAEERRGGVIQQRAPVGISHSSRKSGGGVNSVAEQQPLVGECACVRVCIHNTFNIASTPANPPTLLHIPVGRLWYLQVRDFHCRLSSRGLRDDFETGIDIESMINMEKITGR